MHLIFLFLRNEKLIIFFSKYYINGWLYCFFINTIKKAKCNITTDLKKRK
jgi:hypothetical protein